MDKNTKKDYYSDIPIQFKDIVAKKQKLQFSLSVLDMILMFEFKDTTVLRTRKTLQNIKELFESIDDSIYNDKLPFKNRIWLIKKTANALLNPEVTSNESAKIVIQDDLEFDSEKEKILNSIDSSKISYEECRMIIKQIDDRLNFGYVMTLQEVLSEIFDKITIGDYKSFKAVDNDIYQLCVSVVNSKRNSRSLGADQTFSLRPEYFNQVVEDAVVRLRNQDKLFKTGIRRWNTILGGAYQSKRLYVYLALPGGGKSQILLKTALDFKRYNRIRPSDPDKRPTVLMITMENDIDETIERMFNMVADIDDIRNFNPSTVVKKLKSEGQLVLNADNNMDIVIKYYPNRSIDTNDLYGIIKDMNDDGSEVCCLILDYLKRIRPAEKGKDEKEELKNITNELKTLAKLEDLVVVTAQQLNRSAAIAVDNAVRSNKSDTTRLIGRENVAGAWEIVENSDWTCILNQETKPGTNELYMTFKLVKRRYRSIEADEDMRRLQYFSHPYEKENTIRLIDDIDLDKPLSVYSLASDFNPTNVSKQSNITQTGSTKRKFDEPIESFQSVSDRFDEFDPNYEGENF